MKKIINAVFLLFSWYSFTMDPVSLDQRKMIKLEALAQDRQVPATIYTLFGVIPDQKDQKASADIASHIMKFLYYRDNRSFLMMCKSFYHSVTVRDDNKKNEPDYSYPHLDKNYMPFVSSPFGYTKLLVFYSQQYNAIGNDEAIKNDCKRYITFLCDNESEEYKPMREQIFRYFKEETYREEKIGESTRRTIDVDKLIGIYGKKFEQKEHDSDELDDIDGLDDSDELDGFQEDAYTGEFFSHVPESVACLLFEQGCTLKHKVGKKIFCQAVCDARNECVQLFWHDKRDIKQKHFIRAVSRAYSGLVYYVGCNLWKQEERELWVNERIEVLKRLKVDLCTVPDPQHPVLSCLFRAAVNKAWDFVHPFIEGKKRDNGWRMFDRTPIPVIIAPEAYAVSINENDEEGCVWESIVGTVVRTLRVNELCAIEESMQKKDQKEENKSVAEEISILQTQLNRQSLEEDQPKDSAKELQQKAELKLEISTAQTGTKDNGTIKEETVDEERKIEMSKIHEKPKSPIGAPKKDHSFFSSIISYFWDFITYFMPLVRMN